MKNKPITLTSRRYVYQEIDKLLMANPDKKYLIDIVEQSKRKKRSLSANAVYQSWYGAISDHLAMTIPEATRYIKLSFGLPILFSNADFGGVVHSGLDSKGFFQVSYERQLEYMEKLPVTRLFTTKMHNKLRDDLSHFFGQQGLALEYER